MNKKITAPSNFCLKLTHLPIKFKINDLFRHFKQLKINGISKILLPYNIKDN